MIGRSSLPYFYGIYVEISLLISVSKASPIVDDAFKEAFANAMMNIAKTDEGKEIIKIYSHKGYKKANASDYDKEREAQKLLKKLKSGN